MAIINPENTNIISDSEKTVGDTAYRMFDFEENENLQAKVQGLDKEQRTVIGELAGYSIIYTMCDERKTKNPKKAKPIYAYTFQCRYRKVTCNIFFSQLLHKK